MCRGRAAYCLTIPKRVLAAGVLREHAVVHFLVAAERTGSIRFDQSRQSRLAVSRANSLFVKQRVARRVFHELHRGTQDLDSWS